MLLKKLPLQTFVKNIRGKKLSEKLLQKVSLKTTVLKCCSKNRRSKRSSKLSVAETCQKCIEKQCRYKHTFRNAAQKTGAPKVRQIYPYQNAAKKVPRKSATNNNRAQVLLKKPPPQTFVRTIHSRMPPKSVSRKSIAKNHCTEMLNCNSKKTAAQNARQKET